MAYRTRPAGTAFCHALSIDSITTDDFGVVGTVGWTARSEGYQSAPRSRAPTQRVVAPQCRRTPCAAAACSLTTDLRTSTPFERSARAPLQGLRSLTADLLIGRDISIDKTGTAVADWGPMSPPTDPLPAIESTTGPILEGLNAAILAVDERGIIVRVNDAAAAILRKPASEMLGARLQSVLPALTEHVGAFPERMEIAIQRGDGSQTVLGVTFGRFAAPQVNCRGDVLLFQDVGAVVELRKQRDRLLQMAALGEAMPSVLHELRNPLAALSAMLENLVEEQEGPIQRDLHAMLVQVRRMTLGLEGIGALVRPVIARRFSPIDEAVREACRILESSATAKGVLLDATGPSLPLLPIAPGPISGVVFNLVRNAIDACGAGHSISVNARLDGTVFVLEVRDDGCGMDEETRLRACELFFTSKDKGSGIGLALTKQIAESSGGSLSIESELGVGTTVTMRIPLPTTTKKGSEHRCPESIV